jgi:hypothetical protein
MQETRQTFINKQHLPGAHLQVNQRSPEDSSRGWCHAQRLPDDCISVRHGVQRSQRDGVTITLDDLQQQQQQQQE